MTMAPRGRTRKPAARWTGAIEHMIKMGFKHDDVCRVLKSLLKIYGEDGWWFIESDAYNVLIEALLEAQDRNAQPEIENGNGNGNENENENRNENENLIEVEPVDKNIIEVSNATEAGPSNPNLPPSSSTVIKAIEQFGEAGDNAPLSPPSPPIGSNSPLSLSAPPPQRTRKPCYGWICDDDDEEENEIVEFRSAPNAFIETSDDEKIGTKNRKKRKSRWDLAPEGMQLN